VAAAYPGSIAFCKTAAATVFTDAQPDLKGLFQQRKRWASKTTRYENKTPLILGGLIWIFNLLLLLSLAYAFFQPQYLIIPVGMYLFKLSAEFLSMIPVCKFFGTMSLLSYLPLLSFIH